MGFFFGKGFFCLFLGFMCYNSYRWFSWACSILFFVSAVFYICLGILFRKDEVAKFKNLKDDGTASSNGPNIVRDVNIQQKQNKV